MSLQIYLDSQLTNPISQGDLSNPDRDEFNGTSGESKDRELFLANEQCALSGALTATATTVTFAKSAFSNGLRIRIGSEELEIVTGGGTASATVLRGRNGTTAAAHALGDIVYSAVEGRDLVVQLIDDSGSSEVSWVSLALTQLGLATATPGASLSLGTKAYNQTKSIWRRCVVPAGTPVQNKTDLKIQVSGTLFPLT
jgi:hypothetical protein